MRTRKILLVVAVALLLGTVGAMAQSNRDEVITVRLPRAGLGEMYSRSALIPKPEVAASMPIPVEGPVVSIQRLDPIFNVGGTMSVVGPGNALMTPRGGAISSPKQTADREIKRLIRRLD